MDSNSVPGVDQRSLVCLTNESEPEYPESPKRFIREIYDDNTRASEGTGTSSPATPPKRTAEEAGLNNASNNMEGDSPKKNIEINFSEETVFAALIDDALNILQKSKKVEDMDIRNGVEEIINSFRYSKGNRFSDVDFKKPENICAFLYRYGPYAAGLTRNRILEALMNCTDLRFGLEAFSSIKIISLGSGPGCDIIGLCSALYEHVKYQRVKLTLVDCVEGWLPAFNLTEYLIRVGEYGNVSRLFKDSDVSTTFWRDDLLNVEERNETYSSDLQEADIILIDKLFSILPDYKKYIIEETVVGKMKAGAVLLFIDSPKYHFNDLELIYENETFKDYYFQGEYRKRYFSDIAWSSKAQIYVYKKNC